MKPILGYEITVVGSTKRTYVERPDHATYEIQKIIEQCPVNAAWIKRGSYIVKPVRDNIDVPRFLVRYEAAARMVFTTGFVANTKIPLEQDHDKVDRFRLVGFFYTAEEADTAKEKWAEKYNYNQWRS